MTNFVFGRPYPVAEFARRRFDDARRDTDRAGRALVVDLRAEEAGGIIDLRPDPNLDLVMVKLGAVRSMIDQLLAREPGGRTLEELSTVMPRMLAVSELVDDPVERQTCRYGDRRGLSGLLTDDRLAESLRDQVGLIAAVLLPRFDKGQQASAAELDRVRILLARAAYLTRLLNDTIEIAGATEQIRQSLADLGTIDVGGILGQLEAGQNEKPNVIDNSGTLLPQRLLVPWGERINWVRAALWTAVARVTTQQITRERQFDLIMAAFGVIMVAVMESVVLLSQRVVSPLAHLGVAITRIAAGDRGAR